MPSPQLHLADRHSVADLRTFTARARANDDGGMRLVAVGRVFAAYVCTLRPTVLGEPVPTVLGLRTMALAEVADVDSTVALGSMLDRLARVADDDVVVPVPTVTVTENWAGVLPPRSGWDPVGSVMLDLLADVARAGIVEVARSLPDRAGAPLVSSARSAVWGRQIPGLAVPLAAGAAFGALSLGFLQPGETGDLYVNGRWTRVSMARGHILVRAAATF